MPIGCTYLPLNYYGVMASYQSNIMSLCNGFVRVISFSIDCVDTVLIGQNIYGCTDPTALNYDPLANDPD